MRHHHRMICVLTTVRKHRRFGIDIERQNRYGIIACFPIGHNQITPIAVRTRSGVIGSSTHTPIALNTAA